MRANKRVIMLGISVATLMLTRFAIEASALSVTVTPASWNIGASRANITWTSGNFTVTNNDATTPERIKMQAGNSTSGWTPSGSGSAGADTYALRLNSASGTVISSYQITLVDYLAVGASSEAFTLYYTTPTSDSLSFGSEQTIQIILTAESRACGSGGIDTGGACYYIGGGSCNSICSAHGGATTPTNAGAQQALSVAIGASSCHCGYTYYGSPQCAAAPSYITTSNCDSWSCWTDVWFIRAYADTCCTTSDYCGYNPSNEYEHRICRCNN